MNHSVQRASCVVDKVLIISYEPKLVEGTLSFSVVQLRGQACKLSPWLGVGGGGGEAREKVVEPRFQSHRPLINELLL